MTPRLRLLVLLLPAGCAASAAERGAALRDAFAGAGAGLAAPGFTEVLPTSAPPATTPPSTLSAASVRLVVARTPALRPGTAPDAAARLLGAGPETLRGLLGEPSLRRPEGEAEVWLYTGAHCALDLVLYRDGAGLRVAHAGARANGAAPRTEAACLAELAGARIRG